MVCVMLVVIVSDVLLVYLLFGSDVLELVCGKFVVFVMDIDIWELFMCLIDG